MTKYNQKFKQQAVDFYFQQDESLSLTCHTLLEFIIKEYVRYYKQGRIQLKLNGLNPVRYRIQSLNEHPTFQGQITFQPNKKLCSKRIL